MRKQAGRITLAKETLVSLQSHRLSDVAGQTVKNECSALTVCVRCPSFPTC